MISKLPVRFTESGTLRVERSLHFTKQQQIILMQPYGQRWLSLDLIPADTGMTVDVQTFGLLVKCQLGLPIPYWKTLVHCLAPTPEFIFLLL